MNNENEKIVSYGEAINLAISSKMDLDKSIYILGQGADDPTSAAGPLQGLKERFTDRIMDVPMAEESIAGICVGMAMNGLRPINWHIRMDFLLLAMNQIINMASKIKYMYGGRMTCPVSFRAMIGKSWGQGPQHSQSLYPQFINIPGLKVYAPAIPFDAEASYVSMLEEGVPALMIEHRLLYYQKGIVPTDYLPFVKDATRVLRRGRHITLVGVSQMAIECLRASKILQSVGIEAEVITPVVLKPLDIIPISASVIETGNLLFVDNSWMFGSLGAETISTLHENRISFNSARMGFAETVCPTSPTLEDAFYPNPVSIAYKVCELLDVPYLIPELKTKYEKEEIEFKGPF